MNWLHRLFNPHCPHCFDLDLENKHCATCQVLQMELASVKQERDKLLNKLIFPTTEPVKYDEDLKPIMPKAVPWNVRRQMLEAEDRERAKLMQNAPKPIDELEKEVLG